MLNCCQLNNYSDQYLKGIDIDIIIYFFEYFLNIIF